MRGTGYYALAWFLLFTYENEVSQVEAEYENARPLNLQQWSERPEVDAAIDAIYAEVRACGSIQRNRNQRPCLKVILLNLYACHASDPTRYIRYSRRNYSWVRQYNVLVLSAEQVGSLVDWLELLGYLTNKLGKNAFREEDRRQSRMRATDKLVNLFNGFQVSPLMVARHQEAETIILKDTKKKLIGYEETDETQTMRTQMQTINCILSKTLINMYMPDEVLGDLNYRMITGKSPEPDGHLQDIDDDEEDEKPRGAVDFTSKSMNRVFNNGSFRQGGRLYSGWWQGVPREYRKYIRINRMNTVEVDFSAMHINLIYWRQGIPVPDGDLYTLDGFPAETRKVVKQCLLTLINAKTRSKGMKSIQEHIRGVKVRPKTVNGRKIPLTKVIHPDDRIILPPGIGIEEIIAAFEEKHAAISQDWFFSGKGVELQYWDSQIALEILLMLEKEGVPCLPLHDSFIVSHPQRRGLEWIMNKAFHKVTGRYPKMDAKYSLIDENLLRGAEEMEAHFQMKMGADGYSPEFRENFSNYVNSYDEWKRVTGRTNTFPYSKSKRLNREVYN